MTKTLFVTTAMLTVLVGGVGDAYAVAQAKAPTLKIDGFSIFNVYAANQQIRERGKGGPQPHFAVDVSDLYFNILGSTVTGIEYMYRINLQAIPGETPTIAQNYAQISSSWGTFQIGNVRGPENTMIYDTSRVIGATGGFEGGYTNVYNLSALVVHGNDLVGDTNNATKVVYYTPWFEFDKFGKLQFGAAYTPSTAHTGNSKQDNWSSKNADAVPGNKGLYPGRPREIGPFGLRNMALGATYKNEMGLWSLILSAAGLIENSYYQEQSSSSPQFGERNRLHNARGYQLGGIIGYKDFRFAMGFLDNGRSRLPRDSNLTVKNISLRNMYLGNSGKAFNTGVGYTMGAYQLGASYQRLTRKTDAINTATGDIYSGTVDFTPFQGMKLYVEGNYIRTHTNEEAKSLDQSFISASSRSWERAVGKNSATVGIMGMKISF